MAPILDGPPIVFFDGECRFCNKSIDFIFKHESGADLIFCWLQSEKAQHLLKHEFDAFDTDSIILLEKGIVYQNSTAALRISAYLKHPYSWLSMLSWVPLGIRDRFYKFVARHRKKIMGSTTCALPINKEHRFLS